MPVIQTSLGDVREPKPVPGGERYNLTISEAEINEEKKYVRVSIGIDDHLDAPNVTHFLSMEKEEDEAGKAAFKRLMAKRFLVAFGIAHDDDGYDTDDFAGAQAELELALSEPDENNRVYNRLVLPRLEDEVEKPKAVAKAPPKKAAGRR